MYFQDGNQNGNYYRKWGDMCKIFLSKNLLFNVYALLLNNMKLKHKII